MYSLCSRSIAPNARCRIQCYVTVVCMLVRDTASRNTARDRKGFCFFFLLFSFSLPRRRPRKNFACQSSKGSSEGSGEAFDLGCTGTTASTIRVSIKVGSKDGDSRSHPVVPLLIAEVRARAARGGRRVATSSHRFRRTSGACERRCATTLLSVGCSWLSSHNRFNLTSSKSANFS